MKVKNYDCMAVARLGRPPCSRLKLRRVRQCCRGPWTRLRSGWMGPGWDPQPPRLGPTRLTRAPWQQQQQQQQRLLWRIIFWPLLLPPLHCTLSTPLLPLVSDLDTRGPSGRYKGVLALWRTGRHPLLPPSLTSSDKQVCVQQGGQT